MSDCSTNAFRVPKASELKECPHCGSTEAPELTDCHEAEACGNFERCDWDNLFKSVVCNIYKGGCGASSGFYSTEKQAVDAWNTRHKPTCHHLTDTTGDNQYVFITCDKCGYQDDVDFIPMPNGYDYCPGCGAKVVD